MLTRVRTVAPWLLALNLLLAASFLPAPLLAAASSPDVTRAQFVMALAAALHLQPLNAAEQSFTDVPRSSPYYGFIEAAVQKGWIEGVGGGRFDPSGPLTRAQIAKIEVTALGDVSAAEADMGTATTFIDNGAIPSWARGYIVEAVHLGLIRGYPNGAFEPGAAITQAQVPAFLRQLNAALSVGESEQVTLGSVRTSYRGQVEIPVYLNGGQPFQGLAQQFSFDPSVLSFQGIVDDVASQAATFQAATTPAGTVDVSATGTFSIPAATTTLYYLVFSAKVQSPVQTSVSIVHSVLGGKQTVSAATASVQLVSGWTNVGPFNIDTGSGLHDQQSGVASAIGLSPVAPQTLYLASGQAYPVSGPGGYPGVTGDGGVYKSTDGGQTWTIEDLGLPYTDVTALAVDPTNPQVVVIEIEGPIPTTGYIYKTVNGGLSWQETYAAGGYGLAYEGNVLYATTFHAIMSSADFGSTWQIVASFPDAVVTASSVSTDGQTIYAGLWQASSQYKSGVKSAYAEVVKSTDGGRAFSTALTVGDVGNPSISQIVVNPTAPSNVFVVTSSPYLAPEEGNPSLYESMDGGNTWTMADTVAAGLPNATPVQYLAFDPKDSTTVYAGVNGLLYRSGNGGTTFSAIPAMDFDIRFIYFDPTNDQHIFVGTDQGLYTSEDGGASWTPLNNRPGTLIYDVATLGSQIFTTVQDMSPVYSPDGGASWTIVNRGELGIVSVDPYDPSVVLMWTETHVTGFFYASNDGGKTFFAPQIDAQGQMNVQVSAASGFAFDSAGGRIYLAGGDGIYESTDLGQSWQLLPGSPQAAQTIAVGVSNPNVVYASNWNGLYVSEDFGAHWTQISTMPFHSLAVDPDNSSIVAGSQYLPSLDPSTFGMTLQSSVMISQDGGATFTQTSMTSVDRFMVAPQVYFLPGAHEPALAYTSQEGVFVSLDLGKTWQNDSFNLPDRAVTSLTVGSNGTAYISTYGAGIWTYPNFLASLGD